MTAPRYLASDRRVRVHVVDDPTGETARSVRVGHLVRGAHTLCGHRADKFAWLEPDATTTRCAGCAAVPDGHFISRDLTALGLTYRQLDYACRQGWLHPDGPTGSGYQRTFSPGEYRVARVMASLMAAGLPPEAASRVARTGELAPGVTVRVAS